MHIYNKLSKISLSFGLITSIGMLSACDNNISTVNKSETTKSQLIQNSNNMPVASSQITNSVAENVTDWTSSRIRNSIGFKIKSAADALKPKDTTNSSAIDGSLALNNPSTPVSGRISTLTDASNANLITGAITDFNNELRAGDRIQILSTGEIVTIASIIPQTKKIDVSDTLTKAVGTKFVIKPSSTDDDTKKEVYGHILTALTPSSESLEFTIDTKDTEYDESGKLTFLNADGTLSSDELALSDVKDVNDRFLTTTPVTKKTTNSEYRVYVAGSTRAKSFGAMSLYPAIDLNNTGSADDVLYYTSDNSTGSNFFALNSDGTQRWEQALGAGFEGSNPTFSKGANSKTFLGKKVVYVINKTGDLYCINSDGKLAATIKINDTFRNSVYVDATDANIDYVYAASTKGNLYRLKIDFSNSQSQTFTSMYSKKIADTAFYSSPILNGSSVFVGGENGTFYEIIPNTGDVSRSWDLSLYNKNGGGKIVGMPLFDNTTNTIIVPSGGYLFRIVGSNVTQSPLLEMKNGSNSRNQPYGVVLNTDVYPTGNIISSPVISPNTNLVYVSNGNALFESDISSVDSFKNSANYCVAMSARLDNSDKNLMATGNGIVAVSQSNGGNTRAAMVDTNLTANISPYINYFSLPLSSSSDKLINYMALNEFDSLGHSLKGINSGSIADNSGNVYFTLDNGTVRVLPTP